MWSHYDALFSPKRRTTNRKSRYKNITGFFVSDLMKREIHYESSQEYLLYCSFEIKRKSVLRYYPQPVEIPVPCIDRKGKLGFWNYVPDVLVFYSDKEPIIYEVKSDYNDLKEENSIRWATAQKFALKEGWWFDPIVPKDLMSKEQAYNCKFLVNFRHPPRILKDIQQKLVDEVNKAGELSISDLAASVGSTDEGYVKNCIFHLICINELQIDLSKKISLESHVWIK